MLLRTERLGALTHLLASAEALSEPRRELVDWIGRSSRGERMRGAEPLLHALRAGAAVALLAPTGRRTRLVANAALAATSVLSYTWQRFGSDGADQAAVLVQSASAVARLGDARPALTDAALWFVAAQGTMCYFVSGWSKVLGSRWRTGWAIHDVVRTQAFGDERTFRLVQRFPTLARAATAGVLVLECLFPATYLGKGRMTSWFLGSAVALHVANARIMGLSRFVPAFLAMHPAIHYTTSPAHRTASDGAQPRDDRFPRVAAAAGAVLLLGTAVRCVQRKLSVLGGTGEESFFTASTGNILSFQRSGPADAAGPLIVVEAGLAGSMEQMAWLRRHLSEQHPVLAYSRAGYGRSRFRWAGPYTLDIAARDLSDLIADQARDRDVVIAGHSLGGYLAWMTIPRLTRRLGGRFLGVALLDSSHPDELFRSPTQHSGAVLHDRLDGQVAISLRLGCGVLMVPQDWVNVLPEEVRRTVRDHYADSRLWTTMRREWRAAREHFGDPAARLGPVQVPALVLTAERTAQSEPVQVVLHDEMADAATWAIRRTLKDATHDSLVTEHEPAGRTADAISEFVAALTDQTMSRPAGYRVRAEPAQAPPGSTVGVAQGTVPGRSA